MQPGELLPKAALATAAATSLLLPCALLNTAFEAK